MGSASYGVSRSARVTCWIGAGLLAIIPSAAWADDSIGWDFGDTPSSIADTPNRVNNVRSNARPAFSMFGSATAGNVFGGNVATPISTTSPSSGYVVPGGLGSDGKQYPDLSATGGNNYATDVTPGSVLNTDTSTYFAFSVTPNQPLSLTGFDFGSYSKASVGPRSYALYFSTTPVGGTATSLTSAGGTGTLTADGAWRLAVVKLTLPVVPAGTTVNFQLFGYNDAGSPSTGVTNWRTDDWQLTYAAAPEPAGLALVGVAVAPLLATRRRRRAASARR